MPGIVPTVDLSGWYSHDPAQRAEVARAWDGACRTIGFVQLVGHRVAAPVIEAMRAATGEFFAQPLEAKQAVRPPDPSINRGYAAMGTEGLAYSLGVATRPDLFEAFNIGPDRVDRQDPFIQGDPFGFFAENLWPDEPASLRPALTAYFDAAAALALDLADLSAAALGLPDRWFRPFVERSTLTMRVNNYERRPGDPEPEPGQMRMGAHTDYGMVTVLYADPVPGLQIVGPDGHWHDVVPEPGALVVNLGDMTAQWTNDRWRSTLHRVVPPTSSVDGPARRRSVALFFDANYDAIVECVPTCTDAEHPRRYPPVVAGEHLMAKIMGPRTFVPTDAVHTTGDRPVD